MTDPSVPEDSFIVIQAESEGMPDFWIVNQALDGLEQKRAFPWHLSIIVDCEDTTENGLPTKQEGEVLRKVGEAFDANLRKSGNAVVLASITWNHTRQYLYRVRDPEVANVYLQGMIERKDHLREFDFRMEQDVEWLLAETYLKYGRGQASEGGDA